MTYLRSNTISCAPFHRVSLPSAIRILTPADDGQKVVAGQLPDLAGKAYGSISEQNLGFADTTGI